MIIHSKGHEIGYHSDKPVYEWITFSDGDSLIRVKFSRVPLNDRDGNPKLDLKDGEIMVAGCGGFYK